jgi:heat shock protein HslJ
MTDERMDARLRAAGERWRTVSDTSPGLDVAATVAAHEPEVIAPAPRRPRHWGLFASAALVAAALVVGGVLLLPGGTNSPNPRTNQNTDHSGLVGTVWELTASYAADKPGSPAHSQQPPPRDGSDATFYIGPDGQLVADDSCAVIGAKAQVGTGELTVTDQVVRYRSCTDTVGEMVFTNGGTKVLDGTATYEINGNTLTIYHGGASLHFVAAPAGVQAPTLDVPTFVGAHWKLIKAVDANGTDVVVTESIPFFLDDTGKLTTSDGCNGFNAHVTGIGRVRIEPGAMTDVGCSTASVVRAVLNGTADESVAGATLTIRKPGAGELTYQWVPTDKSATDPAALDGKTWRLSSVVGEPAAGVAQLHIGGTVYAANDGCQDFTGHVSVTPGSIAFAGVPADPPCGGSGGDQSASIDSLLSSGGLWAIRDGNLIIWDSAGAQAFALVFTTGSGTPPPTTDPADTLAGKTWRLVGIVRDVRQTVLAGPPVNLPVTLTFDAHGGVRLVDSCVDVDGTARITAKTVDFVSMQGETHSCPGGPALSSSDDDFVRQVLDGATTWQLNDGLLNFTKGHSELTFKYAKSAPAPGDSGPVALLVGKWLLDSRKTGNSGMYYDWASGVTIPYLQFDGSGHFTGRDGCVRLSGIAAVYPGTLSFEDVHRDDSECSGKPVSYFDDILTTVTWGVSRGGLKLTAHGVTLGFLRP